MTRLCTAHGEELWYDEVVEDSADWWVVRVRTPDGRDVVYRFMKGPVGDWDV